MSRVAYITQSALSKAYATNDLRWMLQHWQAKGIDGSYPDLDLYNYAVSQVFDSYNQLDQAGTDQWLCERARQRLMSWKNIAKFIDTVITHRDYRNTVESFVMPISDLKIKDVYHQLKEIA